MGLPLTGMPMGQLWQRLCLLVFMFWSGLARSDEIPEYRMKAAYLYNFATFTEWPSHQHETFNLCVFGQDPFGDHLDQLKGQKVGGRLLNVQRNQKLDHLADCQVVFIARSSMSDLQRVLDELTGKAVLTVADTPSAAHKGVILNMNMLKNRVTFEANLSAAQDNGLKISSKLMRLATQVIR